MFNGTIIVSNLHVRTMAMLVDASDHRVYTFKPRRRNAQTHDFHTASIKCANLCQ
jgi:hypothetical protein